MVTARKPTCDYADTARDIDAYRAAKAQITQIRTDLAAGRLLRSVDVEDAVLTAVRNLVFALDRLPSRYYLFDELLCQKRTAERDAAIGRLVEDWGRECLQPLEELIEGWTHGSATQG